jgi:hypothetical protein
MPSLITLVGSVNDVAAFQRLVNCFWCHAFPSWRYGGFHENGESSAETLPLILSHVKDCGSGLDFSAVSVALDRVANRYSQ